ncbi:hypothetical protein [Sphingobacterium paramultivorum]|uniref:hypothetical protein n=2 Tax=Sphingobacterium TaxID=28453 RepID=UPI00135C7C0F|nr:hypothetical protein [Sphingobacterium paramultivorum]
MAKEQKLMCGVLIQNKNTTRKEMKIRALNSNQFFCLISLLITILSIVFIEHYRMSIEEADVYYQNETANYPVNPYYKRGNERSGIYVYRIKANSSFLFSGLLQIVPDDRLLEVRINSHVVPLTMFTKEELSDIRRGVRINVLPYFIPGVNQIELKVENYQGAFGGKVIDKTNYNKYIILLLGILAGLFFLRNRNIAKDAFIKLKNREGIIFWRTTISIIALFLFLIIIGRFWSFSWIKWNIAGFLILSVIFFTCKRIYQKFLFKSSIFIFVGSICLFIVGAIVIPFERYSYDVHGHVEYVGYILQYKEIPLASSGWMFYHPSLYYLVSASFLWISNFSGVTSDEAVKILQLLSLSLFILYSYFSIASIDKFFRIIISKDIASKSKIVYAYYMAILLFLLWPSNMIVAIRIGNDIMFDLLFSIGFYFSLCWYDSKKLGDLFYATFFAACCVWAKSNGYILFALLAMLLLVLVIKEIRVHKIKETTLTAIFTLFFVGLFSVYLSFGAKIRSSLNGSQKSMIVENATSLNPALLVDAHFSNFMPFNPLPFIEIPFTDSMDDSRGRQSFWYYLMKTSLFGEFHFDGIKIAVIAQSISLLFLLLVLSFFYGMIRYCRIAAVPPFIFSISLLTFAMIAFRVCYPYSCSNDFRYIYPAILPFVLISSLSLIRFKDSKLILFLFLSFALLSGLFQISLLF